VNYFKAYFGICLEGLKKTNTNFIMGQDSIAGPPSYELWLLTTTPQRHMW